MKGKRGEYKLLVLFAVLLLFLSVTPLASAVEGDEYACCLWGIENMGYNHPQQYGINAQTHIAGTCASYPPGWAYNDQLQKKGEISMNIKGDTGEGFFNRDGWVYSVGCITPPKCSYDIADSVATYCVCDEGGVDKVYKKSDGGTCQSSYAAACTQEQISNFECGDWLIHSPDSGETTKLTETGANLFSGPLSIIGYDRYGLGPISGHYVWGYISETISALKLVGSADDYMIFNFYKLPDNYDMTANSLMIDESPIASGTYLWDNSNYYFNLAANGDLTRGWYLFYFTLEERGGDELLQAKLTDNAHQNKILTDVFTMMNSFGPIPINADNSQTECTAQGFGWTSYTPDTALPAERRCCGDDPQDTGYTDPNGLQCIGGVWESPLASGECRKPNGDPIPGSHFDADLIPILGSSYDQYAFDGNDACCGDDIYKNHGTIFRDDFSNDLYDWFHDGTTIHDGVLTVPGEVVHSYYSEMLIPIFDDSLIFNVTFNTTQHQGFGQVYIELFSEDKQFLVPFSASDLEIRQGCNVNSFDSTGVYQIWASDCKPGSTAVECPDGNTRQCVFQFKDEIEFGHLKITLKNTAASDVNFDMFDISEKFIDPGTAGDLGFLVPDGSYLCREKRQVADAYEWQLPTGTEYFYEIVSIDNFLGTRDYVTNNDKWFYCAADGLKLFGDEYDIEEYGTFTDPIGSGERTCISTIAALLLLDSNKVVNCSLARTGDCVGSGFFTDKDAFCIALPGTDPQEPYVHTLGHFFDDCGSAGVCRIQTNSGDWISPTAYFNDGYVDQGTWCSILGVSGDLCLGYGSGSGSGSGSGACPGRSTRGCFGLQVDTSLWCDDIDISVGLCQEYVQGSSNTPEYCDNGVLVHSQETLNKGKDPRCCVQTGDELAQCLPFVDDTCLEIGGTVKPDYLQGSADCYGAQLSETCCFGTWQGDIAGAGYVSVADSFMCYAQNGNNFIRECCGVPNGECYNSRDPSLYALGGVPLNVIMSFDEGLEENGYGIFHLDINNGRTKTYRYNADFFVRDWSGYAYLEFEFSFVFEGEYNLSITDLVGAEREFVINDYITNRAGSYLWQHVRIPMDGTQINWQDINTIKFSSNKDSGITLNNLFLSGAVDPENSENRFCTGRWKNWVENLDGPTDFGFLNQNPTFEEVSPFQEACDSTGSFGWTGRLCCGDDTDDPYFESYLDESGMCWQGVVVYHDQTIADARLWSGSRYYDKEKALLFYIGDIGNGYKLGLYSCDIKSDKYSGIPASYNGTDNDGTFASKVTFKDGFSVIDSWICVPGEGWIKKDELNRVRFLATQLRSLAENNDYTLLCGEYDRVSNFIAPLLSPPTAPDSAQATEHACMLKIFSNSPDGELTERTIVGLVLTELEMPWEEYTSYLQLFGTLSDLFDIDTGLISQDVAIDCENAASKLNPDASELFTSCAITRNGGNDKHKLYYNRPFNMYLLSDGIIIGDGIDNNGIAGFFGDLWHKFTNFIKGLFGFYDDYRIPVLFDSQEANENVRDFYISQHGWDDTTNGTMVVGSLITKPSYTVIRVDYHNFHNSVEVLKEAFAKLWDDPDDPEIEVLYLPLHNVQTILVSVDSSQIIDWKTLTSVLRVHDVGSPTNFGGPTWGNFQIEFPEICEITGTPNGGNFIFSDPPEDGNCIEYNPSIYTSGYMTCNEPGYGFDVVTFENCQSLFFCGDGNRDPGEECDDGNTVNGDGCDSNCNVEQPVTEPTVYDSVGNPLGEYISGDVNGCEDVKYRDDNGIDYTLTLDDCTDIPDNDVMYFGNRNCDDTGPIYMSAIANVQVGSKYYARWAIPEISQQEMGIYEVEGDNRYYYGLNSYFRDGFCTNYITIFFPPTGYMVKALSGLNSAGSPICKGGACTVS